MFIQPLVITARPRNVAATRICKTEGSWDLISDGKVTSIQTKPNIDKATL